MIRKIMTIACMIGLAVSLAVAEVSEAHQNFNTSSLPLSELLAWRIFLKAYSHAVVQILQHTLATNIGH